MVKFFYCEQLKLSKEPSERSNFYYKEEGKQAGDILWIIVIFKCIVYFYQSSFTQCHWRTCDHTKARTSITMKQLYIWSQQHTCIDAVQVSDIIFNLPIFRIKYAFLFWLPFHSHNACRARASNSLISHTLIFWSF